MLVGSCCCYGGRLLPGAPTQKHKASQLEEASVRHRAGAWNKSGLGSAGPRCSSAAVAVPPARCRHLLPSPSETDAPAPCASLHMPTLCLYPPSFSRHRCCSVYRRKYQVRHWYFIMAISIQLYNIGGRCSEDIRFLVGYGFRHCFFFGFVLFSP